MYAVEFTDMANHAKRLVAKNGMEDVVEVIQCSVEDLKLDAKVMDAPIKASRVYFSRWRTRSARSKSRKGSLVRRGL